jgi:glycosyltransferase involved in cell wall biosynthesis
MNNPLVTVVIPTFNYGRFVTSAVESVLAQTYRNLDIVVVDDGSTDDTRQRLQPYADRIRYLYQPNQGLSAARNTGIRAAKGELIALLDSDDVWHSVKLEVQVNYLSAHPEVGLVATGHRRFADDSNKPQLPTPPAAGDRPVTARQLAVRSHFVPSGVVVREECFRRVGLFDTELRSVEDRDMWLRIAAHFPAVYLETPLFWWRQHAGSMTTVAKRMEDNRVKCLRKVFASDSELRGDWVLRLQAYSYAARTSAYGYDAAGMHLRGLARVVRSILLWPLPFPPGASTLRLERLRMLGVMTLRLARLRPEDAPPSVGVIAAGARSVATT